MEFDVVIQYRRGVENDNADRLSQQAWKISDEAGREMMDPKTTDVKDSACDPSCSVSSSLREADMGAGEGGEGKGEGGCGDTYRRIKDPPN